MVADLVHLYGAPDSAGWTLLTARAHPTEFDGLFEDVVTSPATGRRRGAIRRSASATVETSSSIHAFERRKGVTPIAYVRQRGEQLRTP